MLRFVGGVDNHAGVGPSNTHFASALGCQLKFTAKMQTIQFLAKVLVRYADIDEGTDVHVSRYSAETLVKKTSSH